MTSEKTIARLAGGELGRRRASRVKQHLSTCDGCRALHHELRTLRNLCAPALAVGEAEQAGFRSVRTALRARVAATTSPVPLRPPIWTVLAPVAGVVAAATFLFLAGRPAVEVQAPAGSQGEALIQMSSSEDAGGVLLTIDTPKQEVYRVAVSNRSNDFRQAQVIEVRGGKALDPTPAPRPGEVFFYRLN